MQQVTARFVLFALTAIAVVLFYVPLGHADYTGRWGDGTYGIALRGGDIHIGEVAAGSPAERAGIRADDTLVASPFGNQSVAISFPRTGEHGEFDLVHADGARFRVAMTAVPVSGFGAWDRWSGILAIVPATIFLGISFVLVYLRPSVMTWSFLAYALGYFSTGPAFAYFHSLMPVPLYLGMTFVLSTFLSNFAVLPILPFVIRYPSDEVSARFRLADRLIWSVIALAFLGYAYDWYHVWSTGSPSPFADLLESWLPLGAFIAAAAIIVTKFKTVPPTIRQRFGFLVVGLIVSFIAYAVYFIPGVPIAVAQIAGYGVVLTPLCVAYGLMRSRVLDVNFVVNRAIVYSLLSLLVIAFVSLLDWSLSRLVSEQKFATGIELLVTIGVGFLLDRINRATESFVELTLFRRRRIAEDYLRRAAAALPYATEEKAISDGLTQVPADGLELVAAALYRRSLEGERFEGIATSRDTSVAPPGFERNHLLVRMMQASERSVWLDELRTHLDPDNAAIYVIAIPVTVRHELVAFALYGSHRNGAQIDPEEVRLLEELSREAARAYDHVEAVRIRAHYAGVSP